jgi:hypothetical protein
MSGWEPLIVIVAVECAAVWVGRRLPDKNGWKLYGVIAFCLLMAGLCVYLPLSNERLRTRGGVMNAEACERAEKLIRAGKRAELAKALEINWNNDTGMKNFPEIAEEFLQRVKSVEKEGE